MMHPLKSTLLALLWLSFGLAPTAATADSLAATKAAYAGDYDSARSLAQGDRAAQKLVEWVYLRNKWQEAGYDRITAFLEENPHWPLQITLKKRAEQSLLLSNESPAQIEAHFSTGRQPTTAEGMLARARAAKARGDDKGARFWAGKAWRLADPDFDKGLFDEFANLISADDTRYRLWRLIYEQQSNAAIRAAKRLSSDYQKAALVAQNLLRVKAGADREFFRLPRAMQAEPAMLYTLARFYRRQDENIEAAKVLFAMPSDHRKLIDPEQVWIERRLVARDLLSPATRNQWPTAYKLAAGHGYTSGENASEGEFLAGWIALRFLNQPANGVNHFTRLDKLARTRTDKARSQYWLGRAFEAMGRDDKAKANFKNAAQYETIYYGQLARERIGRATKPIAIDAIRPTAAMEQKIANDELVRAFRLVSKAGKENELPLFLTALSNRFENPQEMAAMASIAWDEGGPFLAVKLAKLASRNGNDIDNWGYPAKAMPDWKHIGPPVEKALVFGLARQESEFNAKAGSGAGARGLMQLMPGTAKLIARKYGLSYNAKKLTADPTYNVTLGAAHLGDLIERFDGSYVLTLVAYNAGPGRARDWVEQFGDPRQAHVDPVDWVENVPYTETRGYIQKVLQNVQVYRTRLDPKSMKAMSEDLARGTPGNVKTDANDAQDQGSCAEDANSIASLITGCQ